MLSPHTRKGLAVGSLIGVVMVAKANSLSNQSRQADSRGSPAAFGLGFDASVTYFTAAASPIIGGFAGCAYGRFHNSSSAARVKNAVRKHKPSLILAASLVPLYYAGKYYFK